MTEDAFEAWLAETRAHQQFEADRTRKLWGRIWVILALTIGAYAIGGWYSLARAQTASVPAYEGGAFAWDYPESAENHTGFRLAIVDVVGSVTVGKDIRQIAFSDTPLKSLPFGKSYTVRLVALAASPAKNSEAALLTFDYLARPQLVAPTNTRTILEWQP